MKLSKRFWDKVDKSGDCWLWTASDDGKRGYGKISVGNKMHYAHRLAYEAHVGPIPKGLCVLHKCDTPKCVNPDHLFLGTIADNNRDRDQKGRHVPQIGKDHWRADLCETDIYLIKEIDAPQQTIADWFGISQAHVSRIKNSQAWRHLETI